MAAAAAAATQAEHSEAIATYYTTFVAYYAKHTPGTKKNPEILWQIADKCARQGLSWLEAKLKEKYGENLSEFRASTVSTATPRNGQPHVSDDLAPQGRRVDPVASSPAQHDPAAGQAARPAQVEEDVDADEAMAERAAAVAVAEATRVAQEQRLAEQVIAEVEVEVARITSERRRAAEKAAREAQAVQIIERLATETAEAAMDAARIAAHQQLLPKKADALLGSFFGLFWAAADAKRIAAAEEPRLGAEAEAEAEAAAVQPIEEEPVLPADSRPAVPPTQEVVGQLRCLRCTVEIVTSEAKFCNACGHPTAFGRFCSEFGGTAEGITAAPSEPDALPTPVSATPPSPPVVKSLQRSSSNITTDSARDGIAIDVTVDKTVGPNPGAIGLSFDRVESKGHTITAMLRGGGAALTGQICLGMIIIAVNGTDCGDLSTKDTNALLLSGNKVALTVLSKPLPVVQAQHLQTLRVIGEGRFEKVSESLLKLPGKPTQAVVYKFASSANHATKALTQEIAITRHIWNYGPNPAIVACLGLVQDGEMLGVVLEHCTRLDLQSIVKRSKASKFSVANLTSFAHQVAKGLCFLHQIHVLHRDLALRNVVVMEDWTAKICDFGLSRIVTAPDFTYHMTGVEISPVKWLAPECLGRRRFTKASDVWSFGILCWELFSKGAVPYRNVASSKSAMQKHLAEGPESLLSQPKLADSGMYATMRACWNTNLDERPTAPKLARSLFNYAGRT